jgi:hypothetical protein
MRFDPSTCYHQRSVGQEGLKGSWDRWCHMQVAVVCQLSIFTFYTRRVGWYCTLIVYIKGSHRASTFSYLPSVTWNLSFSSQNKGWKGERLLFTQVQFSPLHESPEMSGNRCQDGAGTIFSLPWWFQHSWNLRGSYNILKASWILVIKKSGRNTLACYVLPAWVKMDSKGYLGRDRAWPLLDGESCTGFETLPGSYLWATYGTREPPMEGKFCLIPAFL